MNGGKMKKPEEYRECAEQLKAVADPERLRILQVLLQGDKHVSEIATALRAEIVKVSHHLGILRRAGLLVAEKQGRFVLYALHPDVFIAPTGPNDEPQLTFGCCHLTLPR
jgi:ArsR family transcriptional regulator